MDNKRRDVLEFWFSPPMNQHWFASTASIDQQITNDYEGIWKQAKAGELDSWKEGADGCLALCIVLDQFPLNYVQGRSEKFQYRAAGD